MTEYFDGVYTMLSERLIENKAPSVEKGSNNGVAD